MTDRAALGGLIVLVLAAWALVAAVLWIAVRLF
jgi:hypothetical protein